MDYDVQLVETSCASGKLAMMYAAENEHSDSEAVLMQYAMIARLPKFTVRLFMLSLLLMIY